MTRRSFLSSAAGLAAQTNTPSSKPNIILIVADDLGARDLSCYGSVYHETSFLDELSATGLRMTQANAACPVCSPTRAGILTGKYPARLRLTDWIPGRRRHPTAKLLTPAFEQQLPLGEVTLAEVLQGAGYVTASIGKWHLGGEGFLPTQQGFQVNIGGDGKGSPPSYFAPYRIPGVEGKEGEYLTDNLTDRALDFIDQNKGRPFFLYLPHFAVHTPLQAKKDLIAKYEDRRLAITQQSRPVYAAMVESLDQSVGRIMRKLEALKLAGQTAIIFTSDNGGLRYEGSAKEPVTDNTPHRAGKGHLYDGGVRVPLIIRWPGVTRTSNARAVASSIDIMPTVLDILGIKGPPMDGVSLKPLMTFSRDIDRTGIYWHYPHYSNQGGVPSGAVRVNEYKLIEFYEDNRLEVYNVMRDPGEKRNLVKIEPQTTRELHSLLKAWRTQVGAVMPKPNPAYDPATAGQGLTGAEPPTPPADH